MRIPQLLLAIVFVCAAHAQSTKIAKIEEIFRLTNLEQMQKRMVEQVAASMPAQLSAMGVPAEAQADVSEMAAEMTKLVFGRMSWETMKPLYVKAYDETFTEDEISGMVLFYESPAGKAVTEKTPALMAKVIALSQTRMVELMPEMQKRAKELADKQKGKQQ